MKVAALDLGSNTFLMLVVELSERGQIVGVLDDLNKVTRLSEGVNQSGRLCADALERADRCFAEYKKRMDELGVDVKVAVATSAARDANNSSEFFRIAEKYEIPVKIISGKQEAELTFYGATYDLDDLNNTIVVDIGGGSTEIYGIDGSGKFCGKSIDMGSVRLTEMFGEETRKIDEFVNSKLVEFRDELPRVDKPALIAVAGTPTTLAALDLELDFDAGKIEGYKLPIEGIRQWRNRLVTMNLEERLGLKGMQPGREDVIIAGMSILIGSGQFLNVDEVKVSTKGLRYGLAIKHREFL